MPRGLLSKETIVEAPPPPKPSSAGIKGQARHHDDLRSARCALCLLRRPRAGLIRPRACVSLDGNPPRDQRWPHLLSCRQRQKHRHPKPQEPVCEPADIEFRGKWGVEHDPSFSPARHCPSLKKLPDSLARGRRARISVCRRHGGEPLPHRLTHLAFVAIKIRRRTGGQCSPSPVCSRGACALAERALSRVSRIARSAPLSTGR